MMKVIEADKWIDILGSSNGSKNRELYETITKIGNLYNKPNMPFCHQIMVYSMQCGHCRDSLPIWKNLTTAIATRLWNYKSDNIELSANMIIGNKSKSGKELIERFNAKGLPFFIQNFKPITVLRKKNVYIQELQESDFFKIHEGELQPFQFLAIAFNVKNNFIDNFILNEH